MSIRLANIRRVRERWRAFAATRRGKRVVAVSRGVLLAAVVGVLVYQLSKIGWTDILASLPTQPAFYVLILAMYFLLPVTESLIYGRLWSLRPLECLGVMIRKRVFNVDVVGYSGEVYLFMWAKRRLAQASRDVMGVIKDNLIVSSISSLFAAALLIGGLLLSGQIALDRFVEVPGAYQLGLGALAALFLTLVVYRFRNVIFSIPRRLLPVLAAAHVSRFLIGYVLQIVAWWIVIPTASFQTWAVLLVAFVVINRIPFVPSSDLVFVSAGAGITPLLDVPVAPVVSMLLVRSAADRLLNLTFFVTSVWLERQPVSTRDEEIVDVGALEDDGTRAPAENAPEPLNT